MRQPGRKLICNFRLNYYRPTMASKRKVEEIQSSEDFRRLFASAIVTYETAELAVLWPMREYRFDLSTLQQALIGSVLLS